jgi:hypothetical protein
MSVYSASTVYIASGNEPEEPLDQEDLDLLDLMYDANGKLKPFEETVNVKPKTKEKGDKDAPLKK